MRDGLKWYVGVSILVIATFLSMGVADGYEGPVTSEATAEANDPEFWGPTCFKLEPIEPETNTFGFGEFFDLVVLKSAGTNDVFTNVVPGDNLTNTVPQGISHIIKCRPEEEPSPTPSITPTPLVSPTPGPSPTPVVTPTPTESPTATPSVTPTTSSTPTSTPSITPGVTPSPTVPPGTPTPNSACQRNDGTDCLPKTGAGNVFLMVASGWAMITIGYFTWRASKNMDGML